MPEVPYLGILPLREWWELRAGIYQYSELAMRLCAYLASFHLAKAVLSRVPERVLKYIPAKYKLGWYVNICICVM